LGSSLAPAVPSIDMDGVKPGRRSTCPKPQPGGRRAGQQRQAGESRGPLRRRSWQRKGVSGKETARKEWVKAWGESTESPGSAPLGIAKPWPQADNRDRRHRHRSVGLAGDAEAKENAKGTAKNLSTSSTEAVPLPHKIFAWQLFPGLQKQKAEKRRKPRKKQVAAIERDYRQLLISGDQRECCCGHCNGPLAASIMYGNRNLLIQP